MVLIKKSISKVLIIKIDNKREIIKKINKKVLSCKSDFIHFNFGPNAIAIRKGIKKGIINLL